MSDITPATLLRLENLPDEILLDIFQYMKLVDLLKFKGHNQRLNNVLRDVKLNIVTDGLEYYKENDLDYIMNFPPEQFTCLKIYYRSRAFDFNLFQQLRSFTLNCTYLSKNQLDQVFSIKLQYLERILFFGVPYDFCKGLLFVILNNEHFPSIKNCEFTGKFDSFINISDYYQLSNNTIRTLILNRWYGPALRPLLNILPNLRQFEASIDDSIDCLPKIDQPHMSLEHIRVTLDYLLDDLDRMLQFMPNLRRLRVRGKIQKDSVLEHFEKMVKIIRFYTPALQRFDCELYFHSWNIQVVDIIVIQQLDPLFKKIQCLLWKNLNRCYATDLTKYPQCSRYTVRSVNQSASYSGVMHGYDSDHDDYRIDYDNHDDQDE